MEFKVVLAILVVLCVLVIACVNRPLLVGLAAAAAVGLAAAAAVGLAAGAPRYLGGGRPRAPRPIRNRTLGGRYTETELAAVEAAAYAPAAWPPPARYDDVRATRLPYRPGKQLLRLQLHLGQRKLLLWEVEFLARHGGRSANVVYAGAAPGRHFGLVARLFPGHKFRLYDPAAFAVRDGPRVATHRELFTDDTARALAAELGGDVLFLSDIRSGTKAMTAAEFEARVRADQDAQVRWAEIMGARAASLKFRVPYDAPAQYEQAAGELRLQAWAPVASSEARLELLAEDFVDGKAPRRKYSRAEYEDVFSYHGVVRRDWVFHEHGERPARGLDHCYDCAREVQIWTDYLASPAGRKGAGKNALTVAKLVELATAADGRGLERGGHGLCPFTLMAYKRAQVIPEEEKKRLARAGIPANPLVEPGCDEDYK